MDVLMGQLLLNRIQDILASKIAKYIIKNAAVH
jgi:hypothetical protein